MVKLSTDVSLDEMEITEIETSGKKYRRLGKCNKCGLCCKDCPKQATLTAKGQYCNVYNEIPFNCKLYPLNPEETLKGCAYTWEEIKE